VHADWAKKAISALWNGHPPALAELSQKDLIRQVDEWIFAECKRQNLLPPEISGLTILRYVIRRAKLTP
jgi:hypothetical protein